MPVSSTSATPPTPPASGTTAPAAPSITPAPAGGTVIIPIPSLSEQLKLATDKLQAPPAQGQAAPLAFVDKTPAAGFQPGNFSVDHELGQTKIALESASQDPWAARKPVKLKAESKLDEPLARFKSGKHHGELKFDGLFKASADGYGDGQSAIFDSQPASLEGALGLRQNFGGDFGKLKYQAQLYGSQNVSPLFHSQDLPDFNLGASTMFSYSSGPATLGLDARTDALGADSLTTRLDYKSGDAALSLSVGQELPVQGEAIEKMGAQLKLAGKGPLSGYLGGELRSMGDENLKAGLTWASGRTRLSTEAVSTGKERVFAMPALTHSLAYRLGAGWDLKLAARPQAVNTQQVFSLGLQGKF